MRLFEIAPTRMNGPENSLITILGHLKTKGIKQAPLSSITSLMQNIGQTISAEELKNLVKSNTAIRNLVKGIDDDETVQLTSNDDDSGMDVDNFMPGDEQDVAMMAKRAASRRE